MKRNKATQTKKLGFALIITITMMVLLVITAVGLLSLSSIALRASSQGSAQAEAQANARMALMMAIGELQEQLGPDRRVNASASIFSDDGGVTPSAAAGRNHWVGGYDSWDSTSANPRPTPNFRKWLVSGNSSVTENVNAIKSLSSDDMVLWEGLDPTGADRVSVPMVKIVDQASGQVTGNYAWWVGDENSKALASRLVDDGSDIETTWSGVQAAGATAFQNHPSLPGVLRVDEKMERLVSHKTFDLLGADPNASAKSFHDLTPFSLGVIADVARGGLKRDLSLYLDHPISEPLATQLPNTRRLYFRGITWEELWLFHNVWRALEPPHSELKSMTGGVLADSHILMTAAGKGGDNPASVDAFRSDPYSIYKVPNFIRLQWMLSLDVKKKPNTTPTEYDFYWTTEGIATLWNPFDVPIALHPEAHMSYKIWKLTYDVKLEDDAGTFVDERFSAGQAYQFSMIFGTGDSYPPFGKVTGTREAVVLMPGEVLIMSAKNANSRNIAMNAGWNLSQGTKRPAQQTRQPSGSLKFSASPANWNSGGSTNAILNQGLYYGIVSHGGSPKNLFQVLGSRSVSIKDESAADFPNVFKPVSVELPTIGTLASSGKPYPVMLFSHQRKTEESDGLWPWSRLCNPRNLSAYFGKLDDQTLALSNDEIEVMALSGNQDSRMLQLSPDQINRGLFGGSYRLDPVPGQDTVIKLSVPREPPLSLGAFQHALANGNAGRFESGGGLNLHSHMAPEISHAISNSYALPVLPPDKTEFTKYQDHSYHVNRMLWDSWFLSSIAQRQAPHHNYKKTASEVYEGFLSDPPVPLPNSRMKPWSSRGPAGVDALFAGDDAISDAHEIASSKLMVEGAFNVNSTSVEAWKAMLGSLEELHMPVSEGTNSPAKIMPHKSEGVSVPSLLTAYGDGNNKDAAAFEGDVTKTAIDPAQWRGNRKLTLAEIEELAKAMVVEVRKRGPFLSLADFINRHPIREDKPPALRGELALRGALQAALDKTVNKEIFSAAKSRIGTNPAAAGYDFPEAAELPKSMNTPAHLLQADILTAIGPQLAVRSDTFRIRAYGEALNEDGNILAKAWCEAIVQRVPDYIDPADSAEAADAPSPDPEPRSVPDLTSPVNKKFGRRIEIISFRWLTADEMNS